MAFVFQYGSNTSSARLNSEGRLRGDARSLGLACTAGQYDVAFTVFSTSNNCAAADMVRARNKKVWGVLYEVPDNLMSRETSGNRKSFDQIEGPFYRRRKIKIFRGGNPDSPLIAWTYTVRTRTKGIKTSAEYARHILVGLQEHHAGPEYIDHMRRKILKNNPELHNQL